MLNILLALTAFALITVLVIGLPIVANSFVFLHRKNYLWSAFIALCVWGLVIGSNFVSWFFLKEFVGIMLGYLHFYLIFWVLIGVPVLFFKNKKIQKSVYVLCAGLAVILTSWSSFNFYQDITVNRVQITSDKVDQSYQFLHVTDTQFGSLNKRDLEKISGTVKRVLRQNNVSAILFTGDMVDTNAYDADLLSPLAFDNQTPKYFSYGNHEFYHEAERQQKILDQLGYLTLRDELINFNDVIDIIAIDDANDKAQVGNILPSLEVNPEKFNILLYHRPTGVQAAQANHINLMLVGHTHGGQVFPYNLIVDRFMSDLPAGATTLGDFTLYHSDGVGLWGPKMRLGSQNEITLIEVGPL